MFNVNYIKKKSVIFKNKGRFVFLFSISFLLNLLLFTLIRPSHISFLK